MAYPLSPSRVRTTQLTISTLIGSALDSEPQVTLDDGADLVTILHRQRDQLLSNLIGGTEETTTGVIRLNAMANDNQTTLSNHCGQLC